MKQTVLLIHRNCRDAILEIREAGTAAKPSQETTANGQERGKRYFVFFKKNRLYALIHLLNMKIKGGNQIIFLPSISTNVKLFIQKLKLKL